jgi:hypothetical protein
MNLHCRCGTALRKKPKGRSRHACPLDGQKFWQPVAADIDQQLDWVGPGSRRLPVTTPIIVSELGSFRAELCPFAQPKPQKAPSPGLAHKMTTLVSLPPAVMNDPTVLV